MKNLELITIDSALAEVKTTSGTYEIATMTLTKYLSTERICACEEELKAIDLIENKLTIEALEAMGALSHADAELCKSLMQYEINANRMTVEEARLVLAYASNATEEIRTKKVMKIADALTNVINGKKYRRDYSFSEYRSRQLQDLVEKGLQYEEGTFDFTRSFDASLYPKDPCEDYDICGAGITTDDMSREEFANLLDVYSDEELIEGGYVDPEDVFEYGPYTIRDLRVIATFTKDTWVRSTDKRNYSRLSTLLEEIVDPYDTHIGHDLNRAYITDIVLPARRPSATNMIAFLSSFGQECNDRLLAKGIKLPEEADGELTKLKEALQFCSYYAGHICGLRTEDIKTRYKVARPIGKKFYREILALSEGWAPERSKRIEEDFNSFLLKIDDWIFEAQASYVNILSLLKKNTEGETVVGAPALLGI